MKNPNTSHPDERREISIKIYNGSREEIIATIEALAKELRGGNPASFVTGGSYTLHHTDLPEGYVETKDSHYWSAKR